MHDRVQDLKSQHLFEGRCERFVHGPVVDTNEMSCSISCQATRNPLSARMNVVHCMYTPAWLKLAVAGTGAWESTLCCNCSIASNNLVP